MSIVRRNGQVATEYKEFFGGPGECEIHKILLSVDEMYGKGRLFNHMVLKPGVTLGWHVHKGESETYYILRGKGEYNDNGNIISVTSGDTTFVGDGEGHAITNVGKEDLEFIALILYK